MTRPALAFVLSLSSVVPCQVAQEPVEQPLGWESLGAGDEAGWDDNLRWAIDLAARPMWDDNAERWNSAFFLGLDLHKVFSGPGGDWGTLVLQPYVTRLDRPAHPPFFEDGHDWEVVYRICNFNYTGLAAGRFNVRVGHMEVPFGLEQIVNTNGTLRDYMHPQNIGVKADWGASINGELDAFDYELALTRGTGNEWSDRGDPFLVAARLGTPREADLSLGASVLYGEVQRTALPGNTLRRSRVGVDVIWQVPWLTLMGEVSAGEDDGAEVINGLFELDWTNRDESLLVFDQLRVRNAKRAGAWDEEVVNALGVRWAPDARWALSAQWMRGLDSFSGARRVNELALQVRFRF